MYFRLSGLRLTDDEVKAIAAGYKVPTPTTRRTIERRAAGDPFHNPPERQGGAAANGGKTPPDLSLMAKRGRGR